MPGVGLAVLGDGPERAGARAPGGRAAASTAEFASSAAAARDDVLRLFRAADAALLPSAWENFPHTVVEALAVGTPVIATAVGGVPEVVRDGENGLLVPPATPRRSPERSGGFVEDDACAAGCAAAAARSVAAAGRGAAARRGSRSGSCGRRGAVRRDC